MTPLSPLQFDWLRVATKAAAFGLVLANAWIASLDAKPISPPPGLVSWWPGDRNARDVIGDNDGVLKGGASIRHGFVKRAFKLDGINDFVLVPDSSSLRFGANDFTIDLWVKFNTTDGEQVIIEKYVETIGSSDQLGWTLTKLDGNTIRFVGAPGDVTTTDLNILDVQPPEVLAERLVFCYSCALRRRFYDLLGQYRSRFGIYPC